MISRKQQGNIWNNKRVPRRTTLPQSKKPKIYWLIK